MTISTLLQGILNWLTRIDWPLMTLTNMIYTDLLSNTIGDVLCFRLRRRRTRMKGFELDLKELLAPMVADASEIDCRFL
jgi:hypothetical protein